jgi:hypothetical protein
MDAQSGGYIDGNELYVDMTSGTSLGAMYKQGYVLGYVTAVADAGIEHPVSGFKFCIPDSVTAGQLGDIAEKWLEEHPQHRHYIASGLLAAAFRDAFPCKK